MFQEVKNSIQKNLTDHEGPDPVQEAPTLVRLPAYQDEHALWQGFVLTEEKNDGGTSYLIALDDGRRARASSVEVAVAWYAGEADVWAEPPAGLVDLAAPVAA